MYQNWYKSTGTKRKAIILAEGEGFEWGSVRDIDGSYNIVSVTMAGTNYNFYLWSSKTIKTAHKLYEKKSFKKSLDTLKKYSFDVKIKEETSSD
jgi:hypothetical protein